jgi:Spy/CpxP family protein refolding chaperone
MRDNILKYILIISLLLNFSFLGAAGYTHYKQARYRAQTACPVVGGRPAPFGQGMPGRTPSGYAVPGCLFEELALKPEQLKLFQQKAGSFHAALDQKRQQVDRLRTALFGLIRADKPDQNEIEATIAEINRTQEEMQKTVVAHMLEFKSMLDKNQQQRFLNMVEGAMGQRGEMQCP